MEQLAKTLDICTDNAKCHGSLHIKNLWINKYCLKLGEPLIFNEKAERKLRDNKSILDYFAPELKKNAMQSDPFANLERADLWSYGMIFYKLLFGETPIFDLNQHPIFPKKQTNISLRNRNLIT